VTVAGTSRNDSLSFPESSITGLRHQLFSAATAAEEVELEPRGAVGRRRHLLHGVAGHRAEREYRAGGTSCPGGSHVTVRVHHAGKAHRGQEHRHRQLLSQDRGADVWRFVRSHSDPRNEPDLSHGIEVGCQGCFGPSTTLHVVGHGGRQAVEGHPPCRVDRSDAPGGPMIGLAQPTVHHPTHGPSPFTV
jgi:hypothetical protein